MGDEIEFKFSKGEATPEAVRAVLATYASSQEPMVLKARVYMDGQIRSIRLIKAD